MSDDLVLKMTGLVVKAPTGATLVDHVDVELQRGQVLGLIGESGAGKSTIGLAAMGYGRGGCKIAEGLIVVDGISLMEGTRETREAIRGARIAYVAQSAAASFNPAHRIGQQIMEGPLYHGLMSKAEARAWMLELLHALQLPSPKPSPTAIRIRFPAVSCNGRWSLWPCPAVPTFWCSTSRRPRLM